MKVIYVAGPYTGRTHDYRSYFEIHRNIAAATEAAAELAKLGYGFFNPHGHSAHFEVITPEVPPEYWYELDNFFLRQCNAVLLLPGWENSKGARAEWRLAHSLGIHSYESIEGLLANMPPGED